MVIYSIHKHVIIIVKEQYIVHITIIKVTKS